MGKGYRSVLVEVMNPAPQAKCIVGIIDRSEKNSRIDREISAADRTTKTP
jgi:hypothetical protein